MSNEDMIGNSVGGSTTRKEEVRADEEARHMGEEVKSASPAVAKNYTEEASTVLDKAKERVRTLREDGEDYVRKNPTKAVFTAMGVGFVLGLIYKH